MIEIRKFQEKDKECIQNLIENCLIEIFGDKINHRNYMKDLEEINKNYVRFYVAENNGKIIGTIALEKRNENYWLKRMYVEKDYRGTGLAKRLYLKIETYLIKNRIKKIFLSTTTKMKSAQKFYKKEFLDKLKNLK